jgi:ABC-type multidrug transport system fused ATPase/permease subunit
MDDVKNHRYRLLTECALRQWRTLFWILGLTVAVSLTAVLSPLPIKLLVDYGLGSQAVPPMQGGILQKFATPVPTLLIVAAAISSVGLFPLNSALDVGLNWAWGVAGRRMVYDLAGRLFHRLQRSSLLFHSRRRERAAGMGAAALN